MATMNQSSAVFLDQNVTLIEDLPYSINPELIRFRDGALDCLRLLQQAGLQLIIVSNQPGVARGMFDEQDLEPVEAHIRRSLASAGVFLSGFYYCPHHPQADVPEYAVRCFCRKPWPGMIYRAAGEHGIDLESSWTVGDILDDVEAGSRAGCRTILVNCGHETEWKLSGLRRPQMVVSDLESATHTILQQAAEAGA